MINNHTYVLFVIAFCTLLLFGCQDVKKPVAPENLISQNDMVAIYTDAYLMNAARSIDNRTVVSKGIVLDSIMYTKFGIDSLQFAQSNAFYSSDLETYKTLFLQVEENLKTEKTRRDTLYAQYKRSEEAKRIKDSIKEARIDSLEVLFPKVKRDSLFQILKAADTKALSEAQKISTKE